MLQPKISKSLNKRITITPSKNNLIDYVILESCNGHLELHRGRGGYAWKGQKGKKL